MDNDTLTVGVSPDGIKNRTDIRILICYMLDQFPEPLTRDDILTLVFVHRFANSLETAAAIEHLIGNEHIMVNEKTGALLLTPLGVRVVKDLSSRLPNTIRRKSHDAVDKLLRRRRSEQDNVFTSEPCEFGYRVTCVIGASHTDPVSCEPVVSDSADQLRISCYLPTSASVSRARECFFNDPEGLYRSVIAHLTGEESLRGDK